MKVAVIGGGSSYTPELVKGFLDRFDTFPLSELWLVDIDPQRLEIVGGFAQRMVAARGAPFAVRLTTDRRAGVAGAGYVTTQLRVGGMAARKRDEYLGRRHGLIGQETTGVGGMAKALRTIPVLLDLAADMRELAPGALLVNFTNPAGLVTEALTRHAPDVPAIGVCNVPITAKMHILELLGRFASEDANSASAGDANSVSAGDANSAWRGIAPERAELKTLGLNHLSWHRGFSVDGKDVWPLVIEATLAELRASDHPDWNPDLIETLRMLPNYYLSYFYYTARKLAEQEKWPPSRAETVMQVEADLLAEYADPALTEPPADLMKRGGAWYSTLATQLLNAHYNDLNETHVVNVPHRGAVAGWPGDWVLEMPSRISRRGAEPLATEPLPPACFGLLASVKAYELLTVEAAVGGDRQAAYDALLVHPLGPPADRVQAVLDDLLETNREFLPQFARA
ncbi:MAG: 6-phospho-beta-glucosidase [Caldilineales bacterium]